MKKVLLRVLLALSLFSFFPAATAFAAGPGYGICDNAEGYSSEELAQMGCNQDSDVQPGQSAINIIYAVISIMGVLAVIMIIIGGIWYIVSQGDPNRTKRGRDTVIFAALGLVIVLLAFAIVNFVGGAMGK